MFKEDRNLALKLYRKRLKRKKCFRLSFLLPGLGQFCQGRKVSGALFFLLFSFPFYYLYLIGDLLSYGGISLILSQLTLYILQLYDAYKGTYRETSPCEDSCTAGVVVPTFMGFCQKGDFEKAFSSFLLRAPFPFTLGEICPAECERKCGILPGRSLRIREVHRELARIVLESMEIGEREPFFPRVNRKVAVVGGGVAGLTVSYYLASCGLSVEIFEKENHLGGTLNYVPDFKLNKELFKREIEFITSFKNVKVHTGVELKERPEGFDVVIVCVGSQVERKFPVNSPRVIYPLSFLKNPPSLSGKRVLIIGAGDTAFDVARLTVRRGGEAVVLYRGEVKRVRASDKEVRDSLREGVKLYTGCELLKVEEGRAFFSCGSFDFDYIVPAIGFERDLKLIESLNGDFVTGDAASGMTTAVEAIGRARETAYEVLKSLGLSDRAWFMEDYYVKKPQAVSGKNLFVVSESSLCQHCGMKVRS